MTQQPENKPIPVEEILKILRTQAEAMPPSPTSSRYLRALRSFQSSVFSHSYREADTVQSADTAAGQYSILNTAITDWLISLWLGGTPHTTASLYLDIISSLWGSAVKAGLLPKTTLFSAIKQRLKALGPDGWKSGIDEEIFSRALRLTKNAACLIADDAVAADLVLLSLTLSGSDSTLRSQHSEANVPYSPLIPLTEIALLRRDSSAISAPPAPLREIMARHTGNARRKYIFPLRQSERTEASLSKHIAKIVNALFKRARLPQATDPMQTVEALWAYAALRAGIPASALVASLGHAPLGLPVLRLCTPHAKSAEEVESVRINNFSAPPAPQRPLREISETVLCEVGKVFLDNPPRWYALSLRPGVRFTRLCRRLELLHQSSSNVQSTTYNSAPPELFYPCEEIARAIGKQIVVKERPFIRSVVFFKARLTDIGTLLSKIGDLAWCYRRSARPGAPYAEISEQQFRLFQQTIARFTSDYEVVPSGELELKKGDRIEILGGLFAGHEATFDSSAMERRVSGRRAQSDLKTETSSLKPETPNTIYRLNIVGDNGIEWRISVDSRLASQKI